MAVITGRNNQTTKQSKSQRPPHSTQSCNPTRTRCCRSNPYVKLKWDGQVSRPPGLAKTILPGAVRGERRKGQDKGAVRGERRRARQRRCERRREKGKTKALGEEEGEGQDKGDVRGGRRRARQRRWERRKEKGKTKAL